MRGLRHSFAVAALAAMAISANMGGAGLADAQALLTTLCKEPQETCAQANRFPGNTMLEFSTNAVEFENSVSNVTCTSSSFKARVQAEAGEPLYEEISTANAPVFAGCVTAGGTPCTVTSVNAPYESRIDWTSANNGTFKLLKKEAGVPGVDVKCGMVINCRFTAEIQFTMEGGNPARIFVLGVSLTRTGLICPAKAIEIVEYTISAPKPVYVAHT